MNETVPAKIKELKGELESNKTRTEENNAKLMNSGIDDGMLSCYQTLQDAVGHERGGLSSHIAYKTACAVNSEKGEITSVKIALELFDEQKPKDATEAKLVSQAAALYSNGMDCLARAAKTDKVDFMSIYGNLATKGPSKTNFRSLLCLTSR
jgi:hypothetical protein